ncbi:type II toxin-antitoxin system VapC family toxin [Halorussus caseinilyticus]|uniref:type II toxin-antitoxin system VapC family toxin n=1 Tax=Halorussus caseinilyticus TaxID=3034025 RepID=UPI0023E8EA1A|nr:PIN domain-containing protein [Halorussus sp. DT72]
MVQGATPLFIDTGAFFAWAYEQAERHDRARDVFDAIAAGDLPYRPLYTSRSVLSELTTLILRKVGHAEAVETLETIRGSESFNILPVDKPAFNAACDEFAQYDDHQISFVDHTSSVLAGSRDINHIFAFDSDFRTLGFTLVPEDAGRL